MGRLLVNAPVRPDQIASVMKCEKFGSRIVFSNLELLCYESRGELFIVIQEEKNSLKDRRRRRHQSSFTPKIVSRSL